MSIHIFIENTFFNDPLTIPFVRCIVAYSSTEETCKAVGAAQTCITDTAHTKKTVLIISNGVLAMYGATEAREIVYAIYNYLKNEKCASNTLQGVKTKEVRCNESFGENYRENC